MVAVSEQTEGANADGSTEVCMGSSNELSTDSASGLITSSVRNCFGLPYEDHNYGAPPPPTPRNDSPSVSPAHNKLPEKDTNLPGVSNSSSKEVAQGKNIIRCICDFGHEDEHMICCELCLVWQHVDCMGLNKNNRPETYLCEECQPRKVNVEKAKSSHPPPPTPSMNSSSMSPAHNKLPEENTNLPVISNSDSKEEPQEQNITRCICGFGHEDEYMICCDLCLVWQHMACMGLDKSNCPKTYLCEKCQPRKVNVEKAKSLQTKKKIFVPDAPESDDSTNKKTSEKKSMSFSRRRQKNEYVHKNQLSIVKKRKYRKKYSKQKVKIKYPRVRSSRKDSTSTAEEEAQDEFDNNIECSEKHFETAVSNQYTPEVQDLARSLPFKQREKLIQLPLTRHCQVVEENGIKKIISVHDIPRDQPVVEYRGKFLLVSQLRDLYPDFSKKFFPHMIFYTLCDTNLCVDGSMFGNEVRFIRRSCTPNSEVRHLVLNGSLHLYISSTKAIFKGDEITLPFNFNQKMCVEDTDCACQSENCLLKLRSICESKSKKKKGRMTSSACDDSSHSLASSTSLVNTEFSNKSKSDCKSEFLADDQKKKTREERKIDAIMRAFDQIEKVAKKQQQALERKKNKSEKMLEKTEAVSNVKEEKFLSNSFVESRQNEERLVYPVSKVKKGKSSSGVRGHRRPRKNSKCLDISSQDVSIKCSTPNLSVPKSETHVLLSTVTSAVTATTLPPSVSSVPLNSSALKTKQVLLHEWLQEKSGNVHTSPLSVHTEIKRSSSAPNSVSYVQCTEDSSHSSCLSAAHLRSNTSKSVKPVLLKTKDQESAKKRWLRQAMYDSTCSVEHLSIFADQLSGSLKGTFTPDTHKELLNSTGGNSCNTVTPLKKRKQF